MNLNPFKKKTGDEWLDSLSRKEQKEVLEAKEKRTKDPLWYEKKLFNERKAGSTQCSMINALKECATTSILSSS